MAVRAGDVCETELPPLAGAVRGTRRPRRVRSSITLFGYLLRGLSVNCLLAFLILEAVQGVILTVRATEAYSFDILIVFPILVRAFLQAITYSLPLSLLFGASLLAGRLNADREVLALRSFGVSPLQTSLPALGLGAALTIGAHFLNSEWGPAMRYANRNAETMILNNLGYLGEGWNLEYRSSEMSLWARHYDGPTLEDFFIGVGKNGPSFLVSNDVARSVDSSSYAQYLFAKRGSVARGKGKRAEQIVLDLEGVSLFFDDDFIEGMGKRYAADGKKPGEKPVEEPGDVRPAPPGASANFMQRAYFERLEFAIVPPVRDKTVKDMSAGELSIETSHRLERLTKVRSTSDRKAIDYAEDQYWYAVTESHRRLSISLATLFFPLCTFLVALSVSSANRLLPFFVSAIVIPTLYFSGEMLGNYLALRGILPFATQQIGNLLLCALGTVLFVRLCRGPRG